MIEHNVEQGTPEWLALRCATPSASGFAKIVTTTGAPSKQADAYLYDLLGEHLTGEKKAIRTTDAMQRGIDLEPEAANWYAFMRDTSLREVGFITNDQQSYGCSPDRLIGEDGGLEIKCPIASTHAKYLCANKLPSEYVQQVQGCLFVTGREWWDFMSYYPSPNVPNLIVRVKRDDKFITKLSDALDSFCEKLEQAKQTLKEAA